jgi:hypothetical protein
VEAAMMSEHNSRPVVVAVPNDDDLESSVHYAASEARIHQCGMRLVHAHPSGDEGHAELVLGRARAMARLLAGPSVRISTRRVVGEPVVSVLRSNPDARVVVLRRRDSLNLLRLLGSAEHGVVTNAAIASVPRDWAPRVRDPRPVLVGIETPSEAAIMIRLALEIARAHHTALRILHIWHLAGHYDELIGPQISPELAHSLHASLRDELERVRRHDEFADVPVDVEIHHGVPAERLMQEARHAQALLLDRNPPGPDGSVHLGRATRSALYESPSPAVLLTTGRLPAAGGPGQARSAPGEPITAGTGTPSG